MHKLDQYYFEKVWVMYPVGKEYDETPACLWMFALIFALLPVIEQWGETSQRVAVTLDPHTGSWPLPLWLAAHHTSQVWKKYVHTHQQRIYTEVHDIHAQRYITRASSFIVFCLINS